MWKNLQYKEKFLDMVTGGFVDAANAHAVVFFAWVFNDWAATEYAEAFALVPAQYHGNFLWAANSPAEFDLLWRTFPTSPVVFAPFNSLLNEFTFNLPPGRPAAAPAEVRASFFVLCVCVCVVSLLSTPPLRGTLLTTASAPASSRCA